MTPPTRSGLDGVAQALGGAAAERLIAKMRALVKRPVMNRIEPDLEALTEAEGLAMRPGPRPKINAEFVSALREAIITRRTFTRRRPFSLREYAQR